MHPNIPQFCCNAPSMLNSTHALLTHVQSHMQGDTLQTLSQAKCSRWSFQPLLFLRARTQNEVMQRNLNLLRLNFSLGSASVYPSGNALAMSPLSIVWAQGCWRRNSSPLVTTNKQNGESSRTTPGSCLLSGC